MAEAQTLTYDPNEQPEGELTTEEQEALEVGEKLAEQQEQLLAGKFKDAEELEKGYIELQKKLGAPEEKSEEKTTETKEEVEEVEKPDVSFLDTLWEESNKKEFSKETIDKLGSMKPEDIAGMYLEYRQNSKAETPSTMTENDIEQLKGVVGGNDQYDAMMKWAGENLSEGEVDMYDKVMDQGNPLAAFFAVQALTYRFNDAQGVDGQMLQGKASKSEGSKFRSQAEVVRAMSDPQYDKDPAYRQDIYDKLERSDLQF